jgi:hypothetical protein
MSKRRMSSMATNSGGTLHAGVLAQHNAAVQKARLLEEQAKRKEQAKKAKLVPLDKWFVDQSSQTSKALVAFYIVVSGKKVSSKGFKKYGITQNTYHKYSKWLKTGDESNPINKLIVNNKEELIADIKKAPAPTIVEVERLCKLSNPPHWNRNRKKVVRYIPEEKAAKIINDYDHLVETQKAQLLDIANLELSEVKPITKADVIVGVITGVIVGGAMVAYAFLTNGAI